MSPLVLLGGLAVVGLVISRSKKAGASPSDAEKARAADVAEILEEMPTQFWPDWHLSAASYLVQNLGVPQNHESVQALLGMASALSQTGNPSPSADKFAQTIGVMIAQRRQQGKPLFWRTIFRSETAPYFVCQSGNLNAAPGECELAVPLPWNESEFIVVKN